MVDAKPTVVDVGIHVLSFLALLIQAYWRKAIVCIMMATVGLHVYLAMEVTCTVTPMQESISVVAGDIVNLSYTSALGATVYPPVIALNGINIPAYHDLQPLACIRAAPGGYDLLHGVMIMLAIVAVLATLYCCIHAFIFTRKWTTLVVTTTLFSTMANVILCVFIILMYHFVTEMHHEDIADRNLVAGAKLAMALGAMGAAVAVVFLLAYVSMGLASFMDHSDAVRAKLKDSKPNLSAMLVQIVRGTGGRAASVSMSDSMVGKTLPMQHVRLDALMFMSISLAVCILGFFSHAVTVGTGSGVAHHATNAYVHGWTYGIYYNTTGPIANYPYDTLTEFHLVYDGLIEPSYAIKHYHTEYGNAALGAFISLLVLCIIDAGVTAYQMMNEHTRPPSSHADSTVGLLSAQWLPVVMSFLLGYTVVLLPMMILLDVIYVFQQHDSYHPSRAADWALATAVIGFSAFGWFASLAIIESVSPFRVKRLSAWTPEKSAKSSA